MADRKLLADQIAAHKAAAKYKYLNSQMADQSNFAVLDARGHPLDDDNDPLLEALRRVHATRI